MPRCPQCGNNGSKVRRVTLESLLRPKCREDIGDDPYHVCSTPECGTVYFGADGATAFDKTDLSVRFGLKETAPPRPVCYCFDHTVEEIEDEIVRTGRSKVVESIKADMKGPGCRCEYTNPLGRCCLKTVQSAVTTAMQATGRAPEGVPAALSDCCAGKEDSLEHDTMADCCTTPATPSEDAAARDCCQSLHESLRQQGNDRAGALAAGGSVLAAVFSSACCWLPLVLVSFGASAVGVAGFFEAYRGYFVVGAVGLLGTGFYFVYLRKERCEPGSGCATPRRKLLKFSRVMLWTASILVGAFVLYPNYVGLVMGLRNQASATVDADGLASAKYHIEGMTCEGCASILYGALTKLPEAKTVSVDFAIKSAVVQFDPANPVRPETVIEAVKAAGYSATPAGESP